MIISLSIDVEPDLHTHKYTSLKTLPRFLKLLEKHHIKSTFFVTCDCIKADPKIFQQIKKKGHEISLHGYTHERFDSFSKHQKQIQIKKSFKCFKHYLNETPSGFRAPQHSIDNESIGILKKNGFKYDSSLIPWNFYHFLFFWKIKIKFMNHFSPIKIHKINGLWEIPISSFILPFSSITLRILPKPLLHIYFFLISLLKKPVFIMHSWDLIEIPNSKIYQLCKLEKFLEKLDFMLNYFSKKRKFLTIKNSIPPIQTRVK